LGDRCGDRSVLTVVGGLVLGRSGVAGVVGDAAVEASVVVEPVDVGEGGELDIVEADPRAATVDQLPLVETVERFGQRVVVAVTREPTEATMSLAARRSL